MLKAYLCSLMNVAYLTQDKAELVGVFVHAQEKIFERVGISW